MKQDVPPELNEDSFIRKRNAHNRKHLAKEEARAEELSNLLEEEEENDRNFTEWVCELFIGGTLVFAVIYVIIIIWINHWN